MKLGNYRSSLVVPYRGPGKRWGKIRFGNGFTLRAGSVALHLWKLAPNDYSPSRL